MVNVVEMFTILVDVNRPSSGVREAGGRSEHFDFLDFGKFRQSITFFGFLGDFFRYDA